VIIDPVALVAVHDSHKNAETRRDLQPLVDLCRETGAAALGIHHFAKSSSGREPQERLIGSIAFSAMARIVMVAAKTTANDGSPPKNVLMRAKSNIGPDTGGFEYVIGQAALPGYSDLSASRVDWGVRIEGHARDVLAEAERRADEQGPREEAAAFLRAILADAPLAATEVVKAARAEGIAVTTLKRAKTEIGVASIRVGFGPGGECKWSLSDSNL
jgi:putative DNA primase/helicase